MKKIFIFFAMCFLLTGCGDNNYEDYEHYDLSGEEIITHIVNYDDGNASYAIADVTPEDSNAMFYGIFYQVSSDDYILLDEIDAFRNMESSVYFYNDKLYTLEAIDECYYVYNLNYEKLEKETLPFIFSDSFQATAIKEVDDTSITYYGYTRYAASDQESANFVCSLDTYECEQVEDEQ